MKKIVVFSVILTLVSFVSKAQNKTVVGLTNIEISELKEANSDVIIDLNNYEKAKPQYFNSVQEAQNYIDSVRLVVKNLANVPDITLQVSSPDGKFASCGCGSYSVSNIGSAGMFSNFTFSFDYCNGSVSNGNIGASGLQIGWSLGATTGTYNGLYGCSSVTATFGIGILSWPQTVRFRWHFNPNTCSIYFTPVTNGNCSIALGL